MLNCIIPKLPMRSNSKTKDYYVNQLGFSITNDYGDYLIINRETIEIHFFLFKSLDPKENYGQVYIRTDSIDEFYQYMLRNNVKIHPNALLEIKPWGQKEFSLLDPDNNLLTFGQGI